MDLCWDANASHANMFAKIKQKRETCFEMCFLWRGQMSLQYIRGKYALLDRSTYWTRKNVHYSGFQRCKQSCCNPLQRSLPMTSLWQVDKWSITSEAHGPLQLSPVSDPAVQKTLDWFTAIKATVEVKLYVCTHQYGMSCGVLLSIKDVFL